MTETESLDLNPASVVPFELQLLDAAVNYQSWVSDTVMPFLGQSILEVGSGTGNMSRWLPRRERLVLSELNPELFQILKNQFGNRESENIFLEHMGIDSQAVTALAMHNIDTIVSFNVMEHIEDDRQAFRDFKEILNQSAAKTKTIVSFVPAHQWVHGSLDREFGHYRRYSGKDFQEIHRDIFPGAEASYRYFNLFGVPGWYLMGKILKKSKIGLGSVRTFETICPWFRDIDDFLHVRLKLPLGQSILSVIRWEK